MNLNDCITITLLVLSPPVLQWYIIIMIYLVTAGVFSSTCFFVYTGISPMPQ